MRSPLVRLPKPLIRASSAVHTAAVEATGGRVGTRFRGQPVIMLTTTGRTSGKRRERPLVGLPVDAADTTARDGWVVAASHGGHDSHPGWYHNLQANPSATVRDGRRVVDVRARDATADERARHWPRFVETLGTYAQYQEATERIIPVVVLEPVAPPGPSLA